MSLSNKILSIVDPKISLEKVETMDTNIKRDAVKDSQRKDALQDAEKIYGDLFPLIKVGKYRFTHDTIRFLKIKEDSFLPSIEVTLLDTNGNLNSAFFPKADEKLSIYIRSKKDQYKPIRCDFLITDITPITSGNSEIRSKGKNITFNISGILYVPKLWNYNIKAYDDMTSFDLLKQISKELNIGYATNEVSTDDKMTWINPNWNYETFIKESSKHIWKDDNSFFKTYIDKYYYLNLINLNNQFSDELDIDDYIQHSLTMTDYKYDDEQPKDERANLVFSNYSQLKNSPTYIKSFALVNNLGNTTIEYGVQRKMNYYDSNLPDDNLEEKYVDLFVEPLITENQKKNRNSLLPTDPDMRGMKMNKWAGIDYGNGHLNYIFSNFNNHHNNIELDKVYLKVVTAGANLNVIRGMRIPVVIVQEDAPENLHAEVEESDLDGENFENEKKANLKVDRFLTDFYYIESINIVYNHGNDINASRTTSFYTEMVLTKREWKPNELK